jgi:hypothetical protein
VNDRSYSKDVSGLSLSSTVYDIVFPSEKWIRPGLSDILLLAGPGASNFKIGLNDPFVEASVYATWIYFLPI